MVVRVERVVRVAAPPEAVWAFLDDPARRARTISAVNEYELLDDERTRWHVEIPIPLVRRTIPIETVERERDPPRYVKFGGKSKILHVTGEHRLEPTQDGTQLTNRFEVDGKVPGVERYFKQQMDTELDNLERALERFLREEWSEDAA